MPTPRNRLPPGPPHPRPQGEQVGGSARGDGVSLGPAAPRRQVEQPPAAAALLLHLGGLDDGGPLEEQDQGAHPLEPRPDPQPGQTRAPEQPHRPTPGNHRLPPVPQGAGPVEQRPGGPAGLAEQAQAPKGPRPQAQPAPVPARWARDPHRPQILRGGREPNGGDAAQLYRPDLDRRPRVDPKGARLLQRRPPRVRGPRGAVRKRRAGAAGIPGTGGSAAAPGARRVRLPAAPDKLSRGARAGRDRRRRRPQGAGRKQGQGREEEEGGRGGRGCSERERNGDGLQSPQAKGSRRGRIREA
mmetsp:Transcript_46118/g.104180  ORF Transcript_46118/g.104180 Transcript_46118/m.104180 type:complete len:300 (-) Transcript_46118:496-1395(-)